MIKEKYGDNLCAICPNNLVVSEDDINENIKDNILIDNVSIMEAMVKYDKQNLKDKIHFNLTENLFGKLM